MLNILEEEFTEIAQIRFNQKRLSQIIMILKFKIFKRMKIFKTKIKISKYDKLFESLKIKIIN